VTALLLIWGITSGIVAEHKRAQFHDCERRRADFEEHRRCLEAAKLNIAGRPTDAFTRVLIAPNTFGPRDMIEEGHY
jgi:hypothetical protein